MDVHTREELATAAHSFVHENSDSVVADSFSVETSDAICIKANALAEPLAHNLSDTSSTETTALICNSVQSEPSSFSVPPHSSADKLLLVQRLQRSTEPMQNVSIPTSSLPCDTDGDNPETNAQSSSIQNSPNFVEPRSVCTSGISACSLQANLSQAVRPIQCRSLGSSPCPAYPTPRSVVSEQGNGTSDSQSPGSIYRPRSQPATVTPFIPVSAPTKDSTPEVAECAFNRATGLCPQESTTDKPSLQFNSGPPAGRIDEQLLSSAIEGTSGKLDLVTSSEPLPNSTASNSSFTTMTNTNFPVSNLDSTFFPSTAQSAPVPQLQPLCPYSSTSSAPMHFRPTPDVCLPTSSGSSTPFTSFPTGPNPISTAVNIPLPLAPSTSATAALPPSVSLTLSPITTNGDFPPVTLQLPGLPTVILQVLPLPGAKMDEQYTIKVSTPLILSGINGALANGGTMNGGPIMLSIAPGTLPPTSSTATGSPPTVHNSLGSDVNTSPPSPVSTATASCASTTVSFSLPNMPIPHSLSGSNSATTVRLAVPVATQASVQSPTAAATSKRMRAIAPKPSQKLAAHSTASGTSNPSSRSSSVTLSKSIAKRQLTAVTVSSSSLQSIQASTTSTVFTSPVITSTKGKRVQVLSGSPSASRPSRGRRKTATSNAGSVSCLTQLSATGSVFLSPAQNCSAPVAPSQQPLPHDSHLTSQPGAYPTAYTTQPLFVPRSSTPVMTGSTLPTGQMPSTFLFGGVMPPGSVPNGAPYLFPHHIPFPNGCSPFPGAIYNPSGPTSLPPPTSGTNSNISGLPPASNTQLFPPGGATALATIDPTTGMITHYPAPCVPMAVPFSTNGSSTDQAAPFGLSLVYSQPNQSAVGFLIPNVSQAGSLVYPVAGQPLLSTPLSTTLSSGSINFGDHTSLGPPLTGNFAPAGSLVPGPMTSSSLHSTGINISSTLGSLLQAPTPFMSTSISNSTSMPPAYSGGASAPVISSSSSTSNELSVMEDDVSCLAKDDLISIAWRLTQMDDDLVPTSIVSDQDGQPTTGHLVSNASDDIFDVYDQEKSSQFSYSTGFVVDEVSECPNMYTMHDNQESTEIVLLDAKPPSPACLPNLNDNNDVDMFTSPGESTGNADIDALLAAAAMVGAASGVGDAQSAVAVPVPTSFTNVTIHNSISSPSSGVTVNAASNSNDSSTLVSSVCDSIASVVTTCTSALGGTQSNDLQPTVLSPGEPTDLLSGDLFDDFHNQGESNGIGNFDETDEPPSLVAVLGCNAEDAADLESVLGPDSHTLDGNGPVTESFLNSLVSAAPDDLDLGDAEDADDNDDQLFDTAFDVCTSRDAVREVSRVGVELPDDDSIRPAHSINDLNPGTFELDYNELTKNSTGDTDFPIPSSHQVRCLLRNTAPSVIPYRFTSSRNPLVSDKDAVFNKLFEPPVFKKRTGRSHRYTNGVDDFLGMDFPDTVSQYTTAEQFDEALMLLGPQPSPPVAPLSPQKGVLQSIDTNPTTPILEHDKPEEKSLPPTGETVTTNVALDECHESPTRDASNETKCGLLESPTKGETMEKVTSPIASPGPVTPLVTEKVASPSDGFDNQPDSDIAVLNSNQLTPSFDPMESTGTNIEYVIQSDVELNHMETADKSVIPEVDLPSNSTISEPTDVSQLDSQTESAHISGDEVVNQGSSYDEEATLAMVVTDNQLNDHLSQFTSKSSESVLEDSNRATEDVDDQPVACQSIVRRYRTRSCNLSTMMEISRPRERKHRRRLFSAPTVNNVRLKSKRTSLSRSSTSSLNIHKVSCENIPFEPRCLRSQRISSVTSMVTGDFVEPVAPLPVSPLAHRLSIDTDVPQSTHSPSIFGVLASSSVLLEAAADLVGSDSDISPVKSSLEGLATLDRMLKSCQRQSQQLPESSLSKSSSLESEPASSASANAISSQSVPDLTVSTASSEDKILPCSETSTASFGYYPNSPVPPSPPAPIVVPPRSRRMKRRRSKQLKPGAGKAENEATNGSPSSNVSSSLPASSFQSPSINSSASNQFLFWLPSSQRPLSFGLSTECPASLVPSAPNPLFEGDFERHLPRLDLAIQGRLFPDWTMSSPELVEPAATECHSAVGSSLIETTCSEPESISSMLSLPKQSAVHRPARRTGRKRGSSRRRGRKTASKHKTEELGVPTLAQLEKSLPLIQAKLSPIQIAPINLKVADSEAPFARFLASDDLPTFATVQSTKEMDKEPTSCENRSLWTGSNLLFGGSVKTRSGDLSQSSPSVSVASSCATSECIDRSSFSISQTIANMHDEALVSRDSSGVDSQPRNSTFSDTSADSIFAGEILSGFSAPAFPALRNTKLQLASSLNPIIGANQSVPTTAVVSTHSTASTTVGSCSALLARADWPIPPTFAPSSSSSTSNTQHNPAWPPAPCLSTTSVASLTFGSFAGVAAFRATSFSALAARASSGSETSLSPWKDMPTFSDLAKVASGVSYTSASGDALATSTVTASSASGVPCESPNPELQTTNLMQLDTRTPKYELTSDQSQTQCFPVTDVENETNSVPKTEPHDSSTLPVEARQQAVTITLVRSKPNRTIPRRRRRSRKGYQKSTKKALLKPPSVTECTTPKAFCSSPVDPSLTLPVCLVTRLENSSNCPSELHPTSPVSDSHSVDVLGHQTPNAGTVSPADANLSEQDVQTSTSQEPEPFVEESEEFCSYPEPYEVIDICAIDFPDDKAAFQPPSEETQPVPMDAGSLDTSTPVLPVATVLSEKEVPTKTVAESLCNTPVYLPVESPDATEKSTAGTMLGTTNSNENPTPPRELPPTVSPVHEELSNNHLEAVEVNSCNPSALHPPIRLRLNLKARKSHQHIKVKKLNKKKPTLSKAPVVTTADSRVPVISSSTPTSLSIRLKAPSNIQRGEQPTPRSVSRLRIKKIKPVKTRRTKTLKSSDLLNTSTKLTIRTGGEDGHPNSVNSLTIHSCAPPSTALQLREPAAVPQTGTPTARFNSSRSTSVPYTSRLSSVFSRKIFSTAKQERRSSYAQLSRPWRSGIAGSPRKRGHPKTHPTTTANGVGSLCGDAKRPRIEENTAAATTVRGMGRRGRPPSRARMGLGSRVLAGALKLKSKAEESRAIRLVIRLGKNICSKAAEHEKPRSTTNDSTGKHLSPAAHRYLEDPQGADSESSEDSKLDGVGRDSSVAAIPEFEFAIATEAETYMDPNQVQIHRALNRAVALRSSSGTGVSSCFTAPPDDDDDDSGEAVLTRGTLLNSEYPAASCLGEQPQQDGVRFNTLNTQVPLSVATRSTLDASHTETRTEESRIKRNSRSSRIAKRKSDLEPGVDELSLLTEGQAICPDELYQTLLNGQIPPTSPGCDKYRADSPGLSQSGPIYGTTGNHSFTSPSTGRVSSKQLNTNGTSPLLFEGKQFAGGIGCGSDPLDKFGSVASPHHSWRSATGTNMPHTKSDMTSLNAMPSSDSFGPHFSNSVGTVTTNGTEGRRSNSTSSVSSVAALPSTESPAAPSFEKQLDISLPPDAQFYNPLRSDPHQTRRDPLDGRLQDSDTAGSSVTHRSFKSPDHELSHVAAPAQHCYPSRHPDIRHPSDAAGCASPVQSDGGTTQRLPSPSSSMQQQALALAAAAYATLDPMMAVHQQAKAYYDQWASSLFGSWASGGSGGGGVTTSQSSATSESHTASHRQQHQSDWMNAAFFSKQQYERSGSTESDYAQQWPWPSNQRPAHVSDASSDSLAFDRFQQLCRGGPSDRAYLEFAFANPPTNSSCLSQQPQQQQRLFDSDPFTDPSQARCTTTDRYQNGPVKPPGRMNTAPFPEARINGW